MSRSNRAGSPLQSCGPGQALDVTTSCTARTSIGEEVDDFSALCRGSSASARRRRPALSRSTPSSCRSRAALRARDRAPLPPLRPAPPPRRRTAGQRPPDAPRRWARGRRPITTRAQIGEPLGQQTLRVPPRKIVSSRSWRRRTSPTSLRVCSVWWPGGLVGTRCASDGREHRQVDVDRHPTPQLTQVVVEPAQGRSRTSSQSTCSPSATRTVRASARAGRRPAKRRPLRAWRWGPPAPIAQVV